MSALANRPCETRKTKQSVMTIPQPRRAKSSAALRESASSQRTLKPPPLPSSISSISSTPSVSSATSTRSASSTSSGLHTPPPLYSRPPIHSSPEKKSSGPTIATRTPSTSSLGTSERLKLVTSELESLIDADDDETVHVAVRLKPTFGKDRDIWTADPLRGFIGGKPGEFFFGMPLAIELT